MDEFNGQIDTSIWDEWREFESEKNEPDFLLTLVKVFIESVPKDFAQMLAAIDASDTHKIHLLAHSLKSSCRSMGAMSLGDGLEKIEIQARRNLLPEPGLMAQINGAMISVIDQVERERAQREP